ncbi:MAG: hypothetical protein AAF546_14220, partial [Verrucomicrobiota bacterium]
LLVVLTILAVLSTVALRSVAQITEEKRYEANRSQLETVEAAVLGETDISGFIGDIGRLPIAQGGDSLEQLSELWSGGSLPDYTIATSAGDSEVRLGVGWRGPYLDLGIGRDQLTDGYGDALFNFEANGDLAADGETIAIVQSRGVDQAIGGDGVNSDTSVVFEADAAAVTLGFSEVEVASTEDVVVILQNESGNLLQTDGNVLLVRAYGANFAADGTGGLETLRQAKFEFSDATDNPGTPTTRSSVSLTLVDLPLGLKVFRAYQVSGAVPANGDNLTEIPATAPTAVSASVITQKNLKGRTDPLSLVLLAR